MATVKVQNDITVVGTVSFVDETGYVLGEPGAASPSLELLGKIVVTTSPTFAGEAIGIVHNGNQVQPSSVSLDSHGELLVSHSGAAGVAYGYLSAGGGAWFSSAGSVVVQASKAAYGIYNDFGPMTVQTTNFMRVTGGDAVAFHLRGGSVSNTGNIIASAQGVDHHAIAVFMNGQSNSVTNTGRIVAGEGSAIEISTTILMSLAADGTAKIENSGELWGDHAIRIDVAPGAHAQFPVQITNSQGGRIFGDIVLTGDSNDIIQNFGSIDGSVYLGDGNNHFSGGGGKITGTIFGGAGSDVITTGLGNNVLVGGGGNDQLTGAGGVDVAVFDIDSSAATWTQTKNGWTVNAGVLGVDTLSGIEILRFKDRDVSLTGETLQARQTDPYDLNGDGRGEMVFQHGVSGQTVIWYSEPGRDYAPVALIPVTPNWSVVDAADFNGDGRSDLLWRNTEGEVVTWDSTGNFITGKYLGAVPTTFTLEQAADFTGDGRADILWRNTANGEVTLWTSTGAGFTSAVVETIGQGWKVEAAGDFNGDGRDDAFWRDVNGNYAIWAGSGSLFSTGKTGTLKAGVEAVGAGDLNNDGFDDVLLLGADGVPQVWFGGTGDFIVQILNALPQGWTFAQIADMDGNGRDDAFWRAANGDIMLFSFMEGYSGYTITQVAAIPPEWQLL